ncbi:hypothetical protein BSKO_00935 [Bryopsis sp. KO-2023]|nr:hypothetical protein BSKO_00935 [Bryopsis sp. KO-2023]
MFRISRPSQTVIDTARDIVSQAAAKTDIEKASAVYSFVQKHLKFGFTARFDEATPDETLLLGVGHCNPQGALFASLCSAAGLPARQRFVELTNGVLRGVLSPLPPRLLHSYVEVDLQGDAPRTLRVDGYIVDPELFESALEKLKNEGLDEGYGMHAKGRSKLNPTDTDCFCQMADESSQVSRDFGAYDVPIELYRSPENFQRLPFFIRLFFGAFAKSANRRIDTIRGRGGVAKG